jgi:hypothetical protein
MDLLHSGTPPVSASGVRIQDFVWLVEVNTLSSTQEIQTRYVRNADGFICVPRHRYS